MKYNISWSGGKDSTASIILARHDGIEINQINYCQIMWNNYIPADLPEMNDFVTNSIELFKSWGYKVNILRPKPAIKLAYRIYKRSKRHERNGKFYGATAFCRGHCTMTTEKQKLLNSNTSISIVGIAANETQRLKRLDKNISLLSKHNMTENDAYNLCKANNLLSPYYNIPGMSRGGCFFCPNKTKKQIAYIKREYPQLYKLTMSLFDMCDYDISKLTNNWLNEYKLKFSG